MFLFSGAFCGVSVDLALCPEAKVNGFLSPEVLVFRHPMVFVAYFALTKPCAKMILFHLFLLHLLKKYA